MLRKILIAMSCCMVASCGASEPSVLVADPVLYKTHDEILQDVGKQIVRIVPEAKKPENTGAVLLSEAKKCLQNEDIYTASFVMEFFDDMDLLIQFVIGTEVTCDKKTLYESCKNNKRILGKEIEKKYKELYGI